MSNNSQSMTKAEKFRKASKICWMIGAVLTFNYVRTLVTPSFNEPAVGWAIAMAISLGIQYLLTLVESTILTGMLPLPWQINFKERPTEAILTIAAFGCFFFDLMLNLGGTYQFTKNLGQAVGEVKQLGISDYIIKVVTFIATFFFAALFALGSEMLDALADMYDGKPSRNVQFQSAPQEHGHKQQKTESNEQQMLEQMLKERPQETATSNLVKGPPSNDDIKSRLVANKAARRKGL